MYLQNLIIFPVIFFFLNTSPQLIVSQNSINYQAENHQIYFIKQNWHTAIVLSTGELDSNLFKEFNSFKNFELIDIGWGDEEFYQIPGFDSGLAFKALFYSTPSTLRVEGISISQEDYFDISEIVIQLALSNIQFLKICNYINRSFMLNNEGKTQILSNRGNGQIIFFKANGDYYIFNTCNTWLARGLKEAGLNIDDNILLTEQLFNELSKLGRVIKAKH
jgi:uncharacterized protein (TIGR02117 family)